MTFVDVVSTYRAALVDLDSGVGVAVEGHPVLAGLWEELAHLVEELDGEVAR